MGANSDTVTVIAHRWIARIAWVVCPVVGIALGWSLPRIVPWLEDRPLPFGALVQLVAQVPEPLVTIVAMTVCGLGGFVLAAMVTADLVTVTVGPERVRLVRGDRTVDVPRNTVGSVLIEGKWLVLRDERGAELVRESTDLPAADIRAAFRSHGYPWSG